jgi:hypothetical protein
MNVRVCEGQSHLCAILPQVWHQLLETRTEVGKHRVTALHTRSDIDGLLHSAMPVRFGLVAHIIRVGCLVQKDS